MRIKELVGLMNKAATVGPGVNSLDFKGVTFTVENAPAPGLKIRLTSENPALPCVAFETHRETTTPGAYPEEVPFIPSHEVVCAMQPDSRLAVWSIPVDVEDLGRVSAAPSSSIGQDAEFKNHLNELARQLREVANGNEMRSISDGVVLRLMQKVKHGMVTDSEYRESLSEFLRDIHAAVGGSADIVAVLDVLLAASKDDGWEVTEESPGETEAFRSVALERGEWRRSLMMSSVAPSKMVALVDVRIGGGAITD